MSWLETGHSSLTISEYAQHLNDVLLEMTDSMDKLMPGEASKLTAKKIYKVLMENVDLLVPRV